MYTKPIFNHNINRAYWSIVQLIRKTFEIREPAKTSAEELF